MNEFIKKLITLEFNESEAKVYLNLLRKNNFSAAEIAKLSHIAKTKIYDVLDKLIYKGLCTETAGKVKKYSPVNPDTIFAEINKKLDEKKKIANSLSKYLHSMYLAEKDNTDTLDYIQIIRDKKTIINKVYSLENKTEKEILGFDKPPYAMNIKSNKNEPEKECLKRGIIYKVIYEIPKNITPDFIQRVKMYRNYGEKVRLAYELPMKMMIFDEKQVMVSLKDKITEELSLTSILIEHEDIVKAFKITFFSIWENSMSFNEFIKKIEK